MIEMQSVTRSIVTLASAVYCLKAVRKEIKRAVKRRLANHNKAMEALHAFAYQEIKTNFDFWWDGEPSRIAREALVRQIPIPAEEREAMPKELVDMMITPGLNGYRNAAAHLAVHVFAAAKEQALLDILSDWYGLRRVATMKHVAHLSGLNKDRSALAEVGIDVDQITTTFASSS